MGYDLIAFDMDGTVLDSKKQILPSTLEAIREAKAQGKAVAIATGRSPAMMMAHKEELAEIPYAICTSGAHIFSIPEDRILKEQVFDPALVRRLHEAHKGMDVMLEIFSGRYNYLPADKMGCLERYGMAEFEKVFHEVGTIVHDLDGWVDAHAGEITKYNLHPMSHEDGLTILENVQRMGIPTEPAFSSGGTLEFSPLGVTKGNALKELCGLLGIPIERSIAVGDSGNDADMLLAAGLGIAMGNATPDVFECADAVVADNDHDGCAETIRRYLLS